MTKLWIKLLKNVKVKWDKNRKKNSNNGNIFNSQDPDELIRSIRRKRSNRSYLTELSLDGTDSPNNASMGIIENRGNNSKLGSVSKSKVGFMYSQETQKIPKLNDLGGMRFNKGLTRPQQVLNTHKKQDKSKIHKYSPFQKREMDIQKKSKRKSFARKNCGSNSFLAASTLQKAKMAIKKGNRKSSRKPKPSTCSVLEMVSKASQGEYLKKNNDINSTVSPTLENQKSKEPQENHLPSLTEIKEPDMTQSQEQPQTPRIQK